MRLAVIAGDGIGPEVAGRRQGALRSCPVSRRPSTTSVLVDITPPGRPSPTAFRRAPRSRRDSAGRHRRSVGAQRCARAGSAAEHAIPTGPPRKSASLAAVSGVEARSRQPDIDFVVVREGTEGPYTGNGGVIRVGTPHEVATEVSLNTAFGRAGRPLRVRAGGGAA